ncbi:helix-turn-helix domain-containing protein [Methylobacterium sp. WL120]|uniref:helix-turn-helix domain-containing protein n=1 Tax=Methylobacterium sp. WL120 TaxID=2603887 RepID=UPI0011CC0FC9|nr:helix-turn-helix domain-containing protein [Methylobacterium sp. WL120]TXM70163.1 helix-turn-helix domain-containing protein [Methylobacterium sp. WL120]
MDPMSQQPSVLLAEPDAVVAMDLSEALETAGYRVLDPCATTADAVQILEREQPTLAVLDVQLRDGPCIPLSRELRQREIPFLVHTGIHRDEPAATSFRNAPWLIKPALPWDVVTLLDELALSSAAPVSAEAPTPLRLSKAATGWNNPLVRKLKGFAPLSEADMAVLERISAPSRIVPSQTDLVREGDAPEGVFLILEGIACRHKVRATGARQITAYLVPGDFCDLDVALLDKMDHAITTLSACRVVRIAPETVAEVMEHHPQIARAFRVSTLVDEATLREWLVNVGSRSALERLAHLLCELRVRLQVVGLVENNSFDLPLTQEVLADTTGLSNVHLNRTLQELRRRGLIELRYRRLTILDLPRLKALAEFKANYLHLGERVAA